MLESTNKLINKLRVSKSKQVKAKRYLRPLALGFGGFLIVSGGIGIAYSRYWIKTKLTPLIKTELTTLLERKVEIGEVTGFSPLGEIRFDESLIPSTNIHPDYAKISSVKVRFNLIEFLVTRKLDLNVNLIQPEIYLQQRENNNWLSLPKSEKNNQSSPSLVNVEYLQLTEANVILVARDSQDNFKTPVTTHIDSGILHLMPKQKLLDWKVRGKLLKGGKFRVRGSMQTTTEAINLQVIGNKIQAQQLTHLLNLPLNLETGEVDGNLVIKLRKKQLPQISGVADLDKVAVKLPALPESFYQTNGKLTFSEYQIKLDVNSKLGLIPITARGVVDVLQEDLSIQAKTEATEITEIIESLKLPPPPIDVQGKLLSTVEVKGSLKNPQTTIEGNNATPITIGTIEFESLDSNLEVTNSAIDIIQLRGSPTQGGYIWGDGIIKLPSTSQENTGDFQLNLKAKNVPTNGFNLETGEIDIFGPLANVDAIKGQGQAQLSSGKGKIELNNIEYSDYQWTTNLVTNNLHLEDLGLKQSNLSQAEIVANLLVSGGIEASSWSDITATGEASLQLGKGMIVAENFNLNQGELQSNWIFNNWQLSTLIPEAKTEAIEGNLEINGNVGEKIQDLALKGNGNLNLTSGGEIFVNKLALFDEKLLMDLKAEAVALKSFSYSLPLTGNLSGNLTVQSNLRQLDLTGLKVKGDLNFSEGIAFVEAPIATKIDWDGEYLSIETIEGENIQGNGWLAIAPIGNITSFNLNFTRASINLANLNKQLPIEGIVNFNGQISKQSEDLTIDGDLTTLELKLPGLDFEPKLSGKINTNIDQTINLVLQGQEDQILLSVNSNYQPLKFSLKENNSLIKGNTQGEKLFVEVENLPVEIIKAIPGLNLDSYKPLSGQFSGNGAINLNNYQGFANFNIAAPVLGPIKGEKVEAQLVYSRQEISVNQLTLEQGTTKYSIKGTLNLEENIPQLEAKIDINEGQIQDILESLQFFQLSDLASGINGQDYGDAASLYSQTQENNQTNSPLFSRGLPGTEIITQLRYLAKIEAMSKNNNQNAEQPLDLPRLNQLTGLINGSISLNGPLNSQIQANFSLEGSQWEWGDYNIEKLLAKGNLQNSTLTLEPISLTSGKALISFSGYFSDKSQAGELKINHFPLHLIEDVIKLPNNLEVSGILNGQVQVGGSQNNPQAKGEFLLESININQTKFDNTQANFTYKNAHLDFNAHSLTKNINNPISLEGSFPYRLPFAMVKPRNNEFEININIQDRGFRLINIITNSALEWEKGTGKVSLNLTGKFNQQDNTFIDLQTTGTAQISEGIITSDFFPNNPFQQINGEIFFDFEKIEVESLKGNFSGGSFLITGTLPLFEVNNRQSLDVTLDYLTLNIKGLYQGGVEGLVNISGSFLEPSLTGELNLSSGQIILGDASNSQINEDDYSNSVEFNGLKLNLNEDIKLVRQPILNFVANGSLNLFGTFTNPRPEGVINLEKGSVNLFTTYFTLVNSADNQAEFFQRHGLDPYLNVELSSSVSETNSQDLLRDPLSSEISDIPINSFGTLETIRIQARIEGFASQLTNSIDFSSSPPRGQQEILALLGGSFVNTLGRGESTLGLANLAGSAFFGSFQGELADTLGLSELRIFPTPIIQEKNRTETFGLAMEMGIDITKDFSFSVLKILTNTELPQFGVRYHFNDQITLRGSSDFGDDNRIFLEYQLRFK